MPRRLLAGRERRRDASSTIRALTSFLILKAFSAGTTALTGVEAIADGVPAFRYPQSKNAATTLAIMGAISISMFLGISALAHGMDVIHTHESERTVVGEIAHTAFGGGIGFYVLQIATTAILILAANTAYQDFPRLSSILAHDRFMPRQFMNRGDRLVFSNGILILSVLAGLLIFIFDADLNSLIQLYLVGVFISFTLSQTGMVLQWRKIQGAGMAAERGDQRLRCDHDRDRPGRRHRHEVPRGRMDRHRRHPDPDVHDVLDPQALHRGPGEARRSRRGSRRTSEPGTRTSSSSSTRSTRPRRRAVGYVRSIRPATMWAVALDGSVAAAWQRLAPEIPLDIVGTSKGTLRDRVKGYLKERRNDLPEDDFLTFMIPEVLRIPEHVGDPPQLPAAPAEGVAPKGAGGPGAGRPDRPGSHRARTSTKHRSRRATSSSFSWGPCTTPPCTRSSTARRSGPRISGPSRSGSIRRRPSELAEQWLGARIPHPLEIEDSPFRDIATSLSLYLKQFNANGRDRMVTIVIPESVVGKTRHQVLHNQTALIVKRRMLFEDGVVVASVPYHV